MSRGLGGTRCDAYLETAVWDGSQLVYEQRMPISTSNTVTSGTVGYLHAGDLDQPLAVIHNDSTVVVNYDYRGLAVSSVSVTGAAADCLATACANSPVWAGQSQAGVYYDPSPFATAPAGIPTWMGTLVANGGSGGGLLYRRNRYYDPVSGQFTQADPIGLAGGGNLYGFANGDPVNGRDPFGLRTDTTGDADGTQTGAGKQAADSTHTVKACLGEAAAHEGGSLITDGADLAFSIAAPELSEATAATNVAPVVINVFGAIAVNTAQFANAGVTNDGLALGVAVGSAPYHVLEIGASTAGWKYMTHLPIVSIGISGAMLARDFVHVAQDYRACRGPER